MDEQGVIRERLKLLSEYVNDLLELQSVDLQTYTENKLIRRTVERTLHLAVEVCLDFGQHIIIQERFRRLDDNKDIFVVLSEEELVFPELLPSVSFVQRNEKSLPKSGN